MPEYALILILLLVISFYLHRHFQVRLFASQEHAIIFYIILVSVGVAWDHYAIYRGHWYFGKDFLLGPRLGLMPIEEYAFAVIVPYFMLVVYKIIEKLFKK